MDFPGAIKVEIPHNGPAVVRATSDSPILHSPIPVHRAVPSIARANSECGSAKGSLTPPIGGGGGGSVDDNAMELGMEQDDENSTLLLSQLTQIAEKDEKEERPSLSYKDLIIEAIESSPEKRLKLSEIYQVIRYLHPYYQRRADQWGWQNSIRHNLSLHDCFIKLPLKQTSASGVVGHFWTVVRDSEEKQGSTRRRNRASGKASGTSKHSNSAKLNALNNGFPNNPGMNNANANNNINSNVKGKDRQSVSSDSGVMSDESHSNSQSQSNSPTSVTIPNELGALGQHIRKNSLFPMPTPIGGAGVGGGGLGAGLMGICTTSANNSILAASYTGQSSSPSTSRPLLYGGSALGSPLFPSPADSLAMSKNQFLADLLSTTSAANSSSTSTVVAPNLPGLEGSLPLMGRLSGLLGASGSSIGGGGSTDGLLGDLLSAGSMAGAGGVNLAGEIQRLQLLNYLQLYMYQQGLLQQIMLDNTQQQQQTPTRGIFAPPNMSTSQLPDLSCLTATSNSSSSSQLTNLLQPIETSTAPTQMSSLLTQLLLSKLTGQTSPTTTSMPSVSAPALGGSCARFTPPQSPRSPPCLDMFSSPNSSSVSVHAKSEVGMSPVPSVKSEENSTPTVAAGDSNAATLDSYRQLLEQYSLLASASSSQQSAEEPKGGKEASDVMVM